MSNESAYARAGVDIEAGERAVDLMKAHVAATRPSVLADAPVAHRSGAPQLSCSI